MLLIIHPLLCCTWFVGQLSRLIFEGLRRDAAVLEIQRDIRMHLARKSYKELYFAAVSIQLGIRGMASRGRLRFQRQDKAAIMIQVLYTFLVLWRLHVSCFIFGPSINCNVIFFFVTNCFWNLWLWICSLCILQSHCRKFLAQLHYQRLKKAAITTQSAWRARLARKELRKLKMVSLLFTLCVSSFSF